MCKLIIIFLLLMLNVKGSLTAQCPARDSLYQQLQHIRSLPPGEKPDHLNELLDLENKTRNCTYSKDSVRCLLLENIVLAYYLSAEFARAVEFGKQALTISDKKSLPKYYYYMYNIYDSLKLLGLRNEAADSCISNEIKSNSNFAYSSHLFAKRVKSLFFEGDYFQCANLATLGESVVHRFYRYDDSLDFIAYFVYYRTRALYFLGQFAEAERILQSKSEAFGRLKNDMHLGGLYSLYGYLYNAQGESLKAIHSFQKAFFYDSKTKEKESSALALNEIGSTYFRDLKQNKQALKYFHQALRYATKSDSLYILSNIGSMYAKNGMYDSAFSYFQKAFDQIKKGINEVELISQIDEFVNVNNVEYVVKLVLDKADSYLQAYYESKDPSFLKEALDMFKTGDELFNKIKKTQTEYSSKLFWRSNAKRLYENGLEAAYIQNDPNNIFYFFEKSRAVLLNDQISQLSKINDNDILHMAQVKKKILQLERERNSLEISSAKYLEVQKQLILSNQELERLELMLKKNNPLYYQVFLDTVAINLLDVRNAILNDHQALIELFVGDLAVYSMIITKDKIHLIKINKKDFDSTVYKYQDFISSRDLKNDQFKEFIITSNHLYKLIFQENDLLSGRVIISPDGPYFPFELLCSNTNFSSPQYFLKDHAVSYAYSARFLINEFPNKSHENTGGFLGVAPMEFSAAFALPGLPESDHSLEQIGSLFKNNRFLVGRDASRNRFLQQFSNFSIIQMYTHSADSSDKGEPVIYFSDSALYLSDLIPENKPLTRLIVLSACETGNGQLFKGEGVFGFNRAFAALGIPASLTNLWSVDSKSTYALTELFYKYLTRGLATDIALQKAKIEFLQTASRQKSLPYYWAATILTGKTEVLVVPAGALWKWLVAILIFGLLGTAVWLGIRTRYFILRQTKY